MTRRALLLSRRSRSARTGHDARLTLEVGRGIAQEVGILKSLNYDRNIVQFYGACLRPGGDPLLVCEYMEGEVICPRPSPLVCCPATSGLQGKMECATRAVSQTRHLGAFQHRNVLMCWCR